MKLEEALERIYSMHQFDIKLGLEKIHHLLNHLGNPQKKIKAFHVGGSNGKGSTSSFIASILMEIGYNVGLFTSPHLVNFNERIRVNGKEIEDEYITKFIEELDDYIKEYKPTFFELTTALAFKYFSEQKLDYCVIEVGLGGRLDATNVLESIACIITSISLEHTNILGNDIKVIASEKAGIIKTTAKTFIGNMSEIPQKEIIRIANEKQSSVFTIKDFIEENKDSIKLKINDEVFHLYKTPLAGYHQLLNVALAILTLKQTLNIKENKNIFKGIKNVLKNSGLKGRYEIYNDKPKIIFDAAHNFEGVEWFIKEFEKEEKKYSKKTLIFGVMKDKDYDNMIKKLIPFFDEIIFSSTEYERAVDPEELKRISTNYSIKTKIDLQPEILIKNFLETKSNDCLVILGSIYLLGKIKGQLKNILTF